ncbi:phospholipid carrier-dependent glycosyltransferase [Planotetraspora phitsanulokensis]|uniref:Polyprenol-phosphate-mannose--protein mannosyltransferase n=1 Tax=Planotetraspora phitsanulokensis TaxID=575192 RepID=A0A8J3UAT1_9ACTN|nr:phospholipid carrier-dependent glycosyltransferase [Planotetraspora phitsanulokensis]GII41372.1 phospholipid carrier-dependent glycosyltransferase [Planotetraspora phitsanulokensis]
MALRESPSRSPEQQRDDAPDTGARGLGVRARLVPEMPGNALRGWLGPLAVTAFGAYLRFFGLGEPKAVVFDETFYAKDAYSLIRFGVEQSTLGTVDDPIANTRLLAGNTDIFVQCPPQPLSDCAAYIAHPPLGKWMIGLGELVFGMTPFGWRVMAALVGSLSLLILARTARRMTRSTLLGCLAGFLLALDALEFTSSRFALLDVFLMFWILAGFACLVVDRDRYRERIADWYESGRSPATGPPPGVRWWRLGAGLCLGAACAVKWSGVFFLIAFAIMSLVWDGGARKTAGIRRPYAGMVSSGLSGAAVMLGVLPGLVYLLSWTGWFVSARGYGRNWDQATSAGPVYFVIDSLRSWWNYQTSVLGFHTGLTTSHPYMSEPWTWPLLLRPVPYSYESAPGCGSANCSQAVLGTGTPLIWYGAIVALVAMIGWYVASRDWRAGAVLLAYAVGWLPWFYYAVFDRRTMFLFYALPMVPFMVLAIVLAAGLVIGNRRMSPLRRMLGAASVGAFALLVLVDFWWLAPVLTGENIPYEFWRARMLFSSWI